LRSYSIARRSFERLGLCRRLSTITEWSMTRSTGTSGLIFSGRRRAPGHGVAHRGEIDHRRHAGEILHQHARRAEGDLAVELALVFSQAATALMSSFLTVRRLRCAAGFPAAPSSRRAGLERARALELGVRGSPPP
jgi:hypothetical protein